MVTHAAIDGYSRLIVFLKCSDNNKSSTVYQNFLKAISTYGLPSRIRTDQGRENTLIAQHMLENRGLNRASVLTGSSVHNQHVERLWRDIHDCVTKLFYRLFYYLEELGIFNPNDDIYIFALRYIYLPRINQTLSTFRNGWNSHGIRTEHNQSPTQLFVAGALRLRSSWLTALDFFENVSENYGVEEDGLLTDETASNGVSIPECSFHLDAEHLQQLQSQVNPLENSENHGIELYEQTLQFIYLIVSQNANLYN